MFLLPNFNHFNYQKNKLKIENTDNILILCVFLSNCEACKIQKKNLIDISDRFPEITFAYINIEKNSNLTEYFKKENINIDYVPIYLLFKIGIFKRQLNMDSLTKENIYRELQDELDPLNIISKNNSNKNYTLYKNL